LIPPPERVGVQASIETNRSVAAHFEREILLNGLGALDLPVLSSIRTRFAQSSND
jgi:hypothetical protein